MIFCFIAASNNEEILRSSLLSSPDLSGREVSVQREAKSAAQAYNHGIAETTAEVMIFIHNDMYLPIGWLAKVKQVITTLNETDPNWGVLGMFGVTTAMQGEGYVYSTGLNRTLGSDFEKAREVETLDEIVLILRRASGLRFDDHLPGFHFYGADICLQARSLGLKSYAFSDLGIHNTNGTSIQPRAHYWRCYLRVWKKWWHYLPVMTPCMPITRWHGRVLHYFVRHGPELLFLPPKKVGKRVAKPAELYCRLFGGNPP